MRSRLKRKTTLDVKEWEEEKKDEKEMGLSPGGREGRR
jgi:hypothetical protein